MNPQSIPFSGFKFSEMEMSASGFCAKEMLLTYPISELVVAVLVETFIFEPGVGVSWDMGVVSVPRTKNSTDITPCLPLKVIPN